MCRKHRLLPLCLVILALTRFSFVAALDISPTAAPSTVHPPSNGSQNSAALPLNNTSTVTQPAYAFNRGFDKPYQRMTILVAALLIAFLFLGFCAHYVTLRSCFNIVRSRENHNNEGLQDNELQHAGGGGGGGGAARGLESWLIRTLPVVKYTARTEEQEDEGAGAARIVNVKGETKVKLQECAVCLSEFEEGEEIKELPVCGHWFHKACIDMWLFSHTTCPICRLSLLKHLKGKDQAKSLQISIDQSSPNPLPHRTAHNTPRSPVPAARSPHVAVHLELTTASAPFDRPSPSTSSMVNSHDDVDDSVEEEEARNSSAALYPRFPSST